MTANVEVVFRFMVDSKDFEEDLPEEYNSDDFRSLIADMILHDMTANNEFDEPDEINIDVWEEVK